MIEPADYIVAARKLMTGQPTQVEMRRAISTAYYAMFHHLCARFSEIVIRPSAQNYSRAWLQAYRYLDHGPAKQKSLEATKPDRNFPNGIVNFADTNTGN